MADTLAYLHRIVDHVSTNLMPTELRDLTEFLLGCGWESTTTGSNAHEAIYKKSDTSKVDQHAAVQERPSCRICIPNGLTAWHRFIPLAIAAHALVSLSSHGDRVALSEHLSRSGFHHVFLVNFAAGRFVHHSNSGGNENVSQIILPAEARERDPSIFEASDAVGSAWRSCAAALREWCHRVLAEARATEAEVHDLMDRKRFRNGKMKASGNNASMGGVVRVRRLALVVRCCADNRGAVSINARGADSVKSRSKVVRHRRYQSDPLQLFLHEVSAIATVFRARLKPLHTELHFAVLLLPEDRAYGGTLLERQLNSELGNRFCVKLYVANENCPGAFQGAVRRRSSSIERSLRMATLWFPQLLCAHTLPGSRTSSEDASGDLAVSPLAGDESVGSLLLRHQELFFLRPNNAPLCCFLQEALRRFPVLLQPSSLQQLKMAWSVRHELNDVVHALHTVMSPFSLTTVHHWMLRCEDGQDKVVCDTTSSTADASEYPFSSDGIVILKERALVGSERYNVAAVIDALLEAAHRGAQSEDIVEEATLFMVLYEDVIHRRSVRLLHFENVVATLANVYDREQPYLKANSTTQVMTDLREKARLVLRYMLPFLNSSPACKSEAILVSNPNKSVLASLPAPMHLANMEISKVSALQRSVLLAVMPPLVSQMETESVALATGSHLVERLHWWDAGHPKGAGVRIMSKGCYTCAPLSPNNLYHSQVPYSVRLLYLLTTEALRARTELQKCVALDVLKRASQLSDEDFLLTLVDLERCRLAKYFPHLQAVRTLLL